MRVGEFTRRAPASPPPARGALLLGVALTLGGAQAPDPSPLAGTWVPGHPAGYLSRRPREHRDRVEQTLTITVAGDTLTAVTRTRGGPLDDRVTAERYQLDDRERPMAPGDRSGGRSDSGTRTAAWTPDRRGMLVVEMLARALPSGVVTLRNEHTWVVSADGDTLTIRSVTRGPQGNVFTGRVLTRRR